MTKILSRTLLAVSLVIFSLHVSAQQDPQFSQYMFNPLNINPAYAGSRGMMNGALAVRQQWVGFTGAPSTQVLSLNTPTKSGKVGLGLEIFGDALGPQQNFGTYFDYAYRFHLGKGRLALGLGAGVVSYRVNWNKVEYKDPADSYASFGATSVTKPDFKFGIYFNNKNFYTGLSVTHLNQEVYTMLNDTTLMKMNRHSFFTIGRAFTLSENVLFSPSIVIRNVSGARDLSSTDLNLNFRFKQALWVGVSLRTDKSFVGIVEYNINEHFKVGYSYDMTMSRLKTYQSGTHEIVLGFDLNLFQSQVLSPRFF